MANPARSLSNDVGWFDALTHILGSELVPAILPTTVECPLCECDRLDVCDDPVVGGEWLHCRGCRFAGDVIELVARFWGMEVPQAIEKLVEIGVFSRPPTRDRIDAYVRDHISYRARMNAFWQEAASELFRCGSRELRLLTTKLGVAGAAESSSSHPAIQRFLGAATCRQVEELFAPDSFATKHRNNRNGKTSLRRGGGPGPRKMFCGQGWSYVLVMPFFDLPGRISGFLIVGREGSELDGDWIFKRANIGSNRQAAPEAGWGMADGLEDVQSHYFGNDLFVFGDTRVAIRLQSQWARSSAQPLPIVTCANHSLARSENLPPGLRGRRLIFWSSDYRLLAQAKRCDALISNYPISEKEIDRGLRHRDANGWLRLIQRSARPWSAVLRELLGSRTSQECELLLKSLDFTPWELRDFIYFSGPDLQEKLRTCDPDRLGLNYVTIAGTRIRESAGGWEVWKSDHRICSLPIRVDAVIHCNGKTAYYRGDVIAWDRRFSFTVKADEVERRGLFPCVADHLRDHHQVYLWFDPKWGKQSLTIATGFQQPAVIAGTERVGWNEMRRSFLFPQFEIRLGKGVGTRNPFVETGPDTPARQTAPPEAPSYLSRGADRDLCANTAETAIVWALAACVLHNLFCAMLSRKPLGIVLDGPDSVPIVRSAALAMGCMEVTLRHGSLLQELLKVTSRHDWPVLARFPARGKLQVTTEWVDNRATRNVLLPLDRYAALTLSSYAGFARIHVPGPVRPLGDLADAAAQLMPSVLEYACRVRLDQDLWDDGHPLLACLRHLTKWVEDQDRDSQAVNNAGRFLTIDSLKPSHMLVELTKHMYWMSDLEVRPSDFCKDTRLPTMIYYRATDTTPYLMQIPIIGINERLAEMGLPVLDLAALKKSLEAVGAWRPTDPEIHGADWMVDGEWWDERLRERGALIAFCEQSGALNS